MFEFLENFLIKQYSNLGLNIQYQALFVTGILFALLTIVSWISDYISKNIMLGFVAQFAKRTKTVWDDILVEKKVFHRLARIVPALVFLYAAPYVFYRYPTLVHLVQIAAKSMIVFAIARVMDAFLNASHAIYELNPYAKQKPIKGYIQVIKIIVYFICIIFILSIIFNKSLVYFFSGLGALAAVLLLVFKDTILGLVASVQLSSNNMLKPGDWITFNKYNADGTVIEISLHTVKVQNFDKTIVTIPTYALISEAFQNWRGMEESEGRRFKRMILFDTRSVIFCDKTFYEKLKNEPILSGFIAEKGNDIEALINTKELLHTTNMGVFRMYAEYVLKYHPQISKKLSFIVRHGQLNENGICLEIYSFSNDKDSYPYEQLQANLVEHLLAISKIFELSVFQKPSGNDMRAL